MRRSFRNNAALSCCRRWQRRLPVGLFQCHVSENSVVSSSVRCQQHKTFEKELASKVNRAVVSTESMSAAKQTGNTATKIKKELVVVNKLGIHARPAAMFVKTAN